MESKNSHPKCIELCDFTDENLSNAITQTTKPIIPVPVIPISSYSDQIKHQNPNRASRGLRNFESAEESVGTERDLGNSIVQ